MTGRRRRRQVAGPAALATAAVALLLTACGGPPLPNTVAPGTTAAVGWSTSLTSTNPASAIGVRPGNLDVAALTRSQFAERVDGGVAVDEEFGTATIVPGDEFTVSYDLTEPSWSDGIPLDAADLMLAWAAGSNALAPADLVLDGERDDAGSLLLPEGTVWFDAAASGLRSSDRVPAYDEFERRVEIVFTGPVEDWQTALTVAVPAHVVGQRAFGLEDPMEAKQAVITAVVERDDEALAALAQVWNTAFVLGASSAVPEDLLLSSGPYRIEAVDQSTVGAQQVDLVVNREYTGTGTGEFERIQLRQTPVSEQLDLVGDPLDVVQVAPTAANWEQVRDMERNDFQVTTSHDGSYWALALRTDAGDFRWPAAREAFFAAVPRADLSAAGAGSWRSYQEVTDVLLFPTGTGGYEVALEDAGFRSKYDLGDDEQIAAREAAGVAAGTGICVLYDTGEEYAVAALAALAEGVAEAGWTIEDCGADDPWAASDGAEWEAVLTRLPVPTTPAQIQRYWGSDGARSWTGLVNEDRDALITALGQATDPYEARDIRVQIEATIVADAVVVPLAMSMRVTVGDRDIIGAASRPGAVASLTADAIEWGVATP